ncbi:hypothetical protein RHGRI_019678 [Rhododendron griersonianum]|uniref:Rx N-terminal domain-containing protein n=1 Tax=Rhododendron griersonianum TaxID=479676 RepID=A0AAV6JFL7_9ERIC|nr:hypothetical protein RHGRI_019678 [Rhododendron griersonianum]
MAVAEIFLAAFLQGLVRMLTAQDLLSFARREKIHDLLMKWSRMLGEIDAVLADAEEKQMKTEQRGIKLWLEDLEDLAYDLDDILDEFSTEALFQPPPALPSPSPTLPSHSPDSPSPRWPLPQTPAGPTQTSPPLAQPPATLAAGRQSPASSPIPSGKLLVAGSSICCCFHWFRSLFCSCPAKEWSDLYFPRLCPKLLGKLPSNLPCLRKLEIEECPLLVVAWVPRPAELCEVRNMLHFDSLTSLTLNDVSFPDSFGNPELGDDESVEDARHNHLNFLTSLAVENIQGLTSLPGWLLQGLTGLEQLYIYGYWGIGTTDQSQTLSKASQRTGLPPSLEFLYIEKCENLESVLAEEGMKINCPSLQYVIVWDCDSLKSLPDVMQNTYNGGCPRNLCTLHISNCENVESIPEGWFTATNLTELNIKGCKKLKGLPHHASSSSSNNNNNHQHHQQQLTSLQKLQIDSCAAAVATGLVSYILKEESSSYFTNLTSLYLFKVDTGDNNNSPLEWGLHRLSSLRLLYLHDHGWASFPPKEEEDGTMLWLPPSLISLRIVLFQNLEKLSCKDFRTLPSLEQIAICGCPKLTAITELGQLPSLSELEIWDCPNLASFSGEEKGLRQLPLLPPSLLKLEIKGDCPLLKRRCEKASRNSKSTAQKV